MDGFGHFFGIRSLFQAGLCVGIDAVRALHGMGHAERNQRFLPFRQRPFREDGAVITHELFPQHRVALPHVSEFAEILRMVITVHG